MPRFMALASLTLICGLALATPAAGQEAPGSEELAGANTTTPPALLGSILEVRKVLGLPLVGLDGQRLGQIEDLLVESNDGFLALAIVSLTSAAGGQPNELYAVPAPALQPRTSEKAGASSDPAPEIQAFMLATGVDRIAPETGFLRNDWPDLDTSGWSESVYERLGYRMPWARLPAPPQPAASTSHSAGTPGARSPAAAATDAAPEASPAAPPPAAASGTPLDFPEESPLEVEGIPAQPAETFGIPVEVSPPAMLRASQVLQQTVWNQRGDELGQIEDLVLDPQPMRIVYALVSGRMSTEAGTMIAVPWPTLALSPEQDLFLLNVDPDRLRAAPAIDSGSTHQLANRQWGRDLYHYYGLQPYWEEQPGLQPEDLTRRRSVPSAPPPEPPLPHSASLGLRPDILRGGQIIGSSVRNLQGEDLGKISEIVIDPRSGRLAYVVLAHGGFLGFGRKLFAVPWDALTYRPDEGHFILNLSREVLEADEGFDTSAWPTAPTLPQPDAAGRPD
jgi:sporulation protein YlmC with PRC-barrel domain